MQYYEWKQNYKYADILIRRNVLSTKEWYQSSMFKKTPQV